MINQLIYSRWVIVLAGGRGGAPLPDCADVYQKTGRKSAMSAAGWLLRVPKKNTRRAFRTQMTPSFLRLHPFFLYFHSSLFPLSVRVRRQEPPSYVNREYFI